MKLPLACPSCGSVIPSMRVVQRRRRAVGLCDNCGTRTAIHLPALTKKLVYLDQWFLSAVCLEADMPHAKAEVRLHRKLLTLKTQQKAQFVISDIHSRETAGVPDTQKDHRARLWNFANDLADGCIGNSWPDVFHEQQRRQLREFALPESFHWSDLGLRDPHVFRVGTQIQMSNHWRVRLHDEDRAQAFLNQEYQAMLRRQAQELPAKSSSEDVLKCVQSIFRNQMKGGIAAHSKSLVARQLLKELIAKMESGQGVEDGQGHHLGMPEWADSPFRAFVAGVLKDLSDEATERWLNLLDGDPIGWCASLRLRGSFEAALLHRWHTGTKPTNPQTFHVQYGVSRQGDIDHLATYIPYVDAFLTDDSMRALCNHEVIAKEIKRYPCRLFSRQSYPEFEAWLDDLLQQPNPTLLS